MSALELALLSCLLLGLRHGFDYDHLAAIADITSLEKSWREGMRLGLVYALGHALTVAVLGAGVLLLHLSLPVGLDRVSERLVGATLVVLTVYVLVAALRHSHAHQVQSQSRLALVITATQQLLWRARRLMGQEVEAPAPFRFRYDRGSVFAVGIIHGVGAETPSQLLLFLLAANLGGPAKGMLGLGAFLCGLLVMNTAMTASAAGAFTGARQRPWLRTGLNIATACYSGAVGCVFLFGWSERLPALLR